MLHFDALMLCAFSHCDFTTIGHDRCMAAVESLTTIQEPKAQRSAAFDIFGLLCIKVIALCLLYFAFFGENHHIATSAPAVASHSAR
jgi:hypothetical protein